MPECQNCGGFVTKDFRRVFGRDGEVRGCLQCKLKTEIRNNGAWS